MDQEALLVPKASFVATDLSQHISLGRTFDLVQSLEVAEHLPAAAAEQFVDNLVAHAAVVLFSAAVPGQGGEHHVNERPYSYWRRLFSDRGYAMFDLVRPFLNDCRIVEPWYRFNTFVYIARDRVATLPRETHPFRIDSEDPIPDVSPLSYRVRKMAIRMLPLRAVTGLATLKKQLHVARNARSTHRLSYDT